MSHAVKVCYTKQHPEGLV